MSGNRLRETLYGWMEDVSFRSAIAVVGAIGVAVLAGVMMLVIVLTGHSAAPASTVTVTGPDAARSSPPASLASPSSSLPSLSPSPLPSPSPDVPPTSVAPVAPVPSTAPATPEPTRRRSRPPRPSPSSAFPTAPRTISWIPTIAP